MAEEDRVHFIIGECAKGAICRRTSFARVTVYDPDARFFRLDDLALAEFFVQLLSVVVTGNRNDRCDRFEQLDGDRFRQISAVRDDVHFCARQSANERGRQFASEAREMRVGNYADDQFSEITRGVR